MRVDQMTTTDVLAVLKPIWLTVPVAARDVRQHIEAILSAAKAAGHRKGDNPAVWKDNLKHLLPKQPKKGSIRGLHKSLPYDEMAGFMRELAAIDTVGAQMLETCILTCARTNEIVNMRWSQIDKTKATGTVPASYMKMDKTHVVPLSRPVMTFLRNAYEMRFGDFVFPGRIRDASMSNMTMLELLNDMPRRDNITAHGFRATFTTWADEEMNFSNEAAEFRLAHIPGDEAEKAYRRGSMLKKREQIMAAWAIHCTKPPAKIISIDRRKRA
jgi:integrase